MTNTGLHGKLTEILLHASKFVSTWERLEALSFYSQAWLWCWEAEKWFKEK